MAFVSVIFIIIWLQMSQNFIIKIVIIFMRNRGKKLLLFSEKIDKKLEKNNFLIIVNDFGIDLDFDWNQNLMRSDL